MGRKIPAKKHRGVKDPQVQQARRLQSLQGRINSPPQDPDEQPVPRSLLRLFPSSFAPPAPRRTRPAPTQQSNTPSPALGALRRGAGEGAKAFSQRITEAVRALSTPAAALQYPVEHEHSEEESRSGYAAERRRRRRKGEPKGQEVALNRKERRKQRLREQRAAQRQQWAAAARELPQYERVPFGEVAPRPPQLAKPVKVGGAKGAGMGVGMGVGAERAAGRGAERAAGRGAERAAQRAEAVRRAAVGAYRALKAQRRAAQPPRK